MRLLTIVLSLFSLAAATSTPMEDWEEFKKSYGRTYENAIEEAKRFNIFTENIRKAAERTLQEKVNGGTAIHGVTQFSDLTPEEFRENFLGFVPEQDMGFSSDPSLNLPKLNTGVGALVDWTSKYTTPVKNQICGSCWAHSAVEQFESDIMRLKKVTYELSPAMITQCSKTDGCNGGNIGPALDWIQANGIENATDYPWPTNPKPSSTDTGACTKNSRKYIQYTVSAKYNVSGIDYGGTEAAQASYIQSKGPLANSICGDDIQGYKSGIMSTCTSDCKINHAVQMVGVDPTSTGYWKIRNSWGSGWGEAGFIRVKYGKNMCRVSSKNTFYTAVGLRA